MGITINTTDTSTRSVLGFLNFVYTFLTVVFTPSFGPRVLVVDLVHPRFNPHLIRGGFFICILGVSFTWTRGWWCFASHTWCHYPHLHSVKSLTRPPYFFIKFCAPFSVGDSGHFLVLWLRNSVVCYAHHTRHIGLVGIGWGQKPAKSRG